MLEIVAFLAALAVLRLLRRRPEPRPVTINLHVYSWPAGPGERVPEIEPPLLLTERVDSNVIPLHRRARQ